MAKPTIRSVLWDIGSGLLFLAFLGAMLGFLVGVFVFGPPLVVAIIQEIMR